MALSTETQAWLDELKKEGSLDDAAYAQLKGTFEANSKADGFVKGSALRQADYSRNMATVQAAQKAVEDAQATLAKREQDVTKYQQDLAQWKTGADKNFQAAIQDREKATVKAQAALARLKSLAVANGLSEDDVLKDLDVAPPNNQPNPQDQNRPAFDDSLYVKRSEIAQTVQESALIDASIHDVAAEYFDLTGKPLRDASKLVQEAIAARKPIMQFASEKFGFDKLKADRAEADIKKRIEDEVTARTAKLVSDGVLNGNTGGRGLRDDLHGSPILERAAAGTLDTKSNESGISAAVAAFQSGKFRPGGNR
jgi:hypothetical protein